MKNNIKIKLKDGFNYTLNLKTSFVELVKIDKLLRLPLSVWKTIIQEKLGICLLDLLLNLSKNVVLTFSSSKYLKSFVYQDSSFWIDKETRNSLFNLLNSLDENSNFDLIVGDEIITLSVSKAKDFLILLELYASACKVQTLKHINNIKKIEKLEDLLKYDYTLGYPDLINLNDFI